MQDGKRAFDGLARDIADHIERETQGNIERGMTPDEARRQARLKFGNVALVAEDTRAVWVSRWADELRQDVRYTLRTLRRDRGFAAVVVLTLALGIGANAAIFSLVDTVLLRLLPVERPRELVFLRTAGIDGRLRDAPPYPCFARLRDETAALAGMAAFAADELRVEVDGAVEQVFGQVASGSYFDVLGLTPAAGRLMTAADEALDPLVAVISYGYWQRRFNGDPSAIGRTIAFRDRPHTIVGVTPAGFSGLFPGRQVDVTLPITQERRMVVNASATWFDVVARLRADATVDQATAQADAIFRAYQEERAAPGDTRRQSFDRVVLSPAAQGMDQLRSRFATPLHALTLAAAVVLLIACINLGNLLMARGATRAREFAIRLAIGAGSGRLLRQLLTETVVLFLMGAAGALVIARAAIDGLTGFFATGRNPIVLEVRYDWRLAAFAAAVAMAAGLVTALWPAVRAARTDPHAAMKEGDARLPRSRRLASSGRVLVVGQLALSLVLLVSAIVFVKTIVNLRALDLGFEGRRVLTMSLNPAFRGDAAAEAQQQFWSRVLERVGALTGVRAASLSVLTPLSGRDTGRAVTVTGFQPRSEADRNVRLNHVSDDYFRTFGIDFVSGRAFTVGDRRKVAVINEAAARFYFSGRSPLGETVRFGDAAAYEVVGVVRDHKHRSVREAAPRFMFVPLWQPLDRASRMTLAVSSGLPVAALARAVAHEVRAIHPNTLVSDVVDVREQIDATLVSERLLSTLATVFAALALLVAAIGLYGILSYSVACRRTEIGLRMALGATRARVAVSVFREVLLQVAAGLAIGLPVAVSAVRMTEGLLFGVTPADAGSYLLSAILLAAIACAAAWPPVRRACSVDPSETLRSA